MIGCAAGATGWNPLRSMLPQDLLPFTKSQMAWARQSVVSWRKPKFSRTAAANNKAR